MSLIRQFALVAILCGLGFAAYRYGWPLVAPADGRQAASGPAGVQNADRRRGADRAATVLVKAVELRAERTRIKAIGTAMANRCALCQTGILRDLHTNIPRGFFTHAKPGDAVEAVLVTQNPGQPMEGKGEYRLYEALSPPECVSTHRDFLRKCFYGGIGKPFHRRLLNWLSELFELPTQEAFNHVVYANLIKCTTKNNSVPNREVTDNCVRNHLISEIAFWSPKVIIALGRTTSNKLTSYDIKHHYLPHPSHREHREYHVQFLNDIRRSHEFQITRPNTRTYLS